MKQVSLKSGKFRHTRGVVLIETAFTLPILLVLIAGVVNLSSMLWQIKVAQEGVRFASRRAALRAYDGVDCSVIASDASAHLNSFLDTSGQSMGINLQTKWSQDVCFSPLDYDGYSAWGITVSMQAKNENNCIFCFDSIVSKLTPRFTRTFALGWRCSGTGTLCPNPT